MGSILIKNGNVIDPKNNIDEVLDILVINGKIAKVEKGIKYETDKTIEAKDLWVVPGLIDLHVHLREPGFTDKETIKTGTLSASKGGVTTLCAMPNTNPTMDSNELVEDFISRCEKDAVVNVLPIGSITKGLKGEEIAPITLMKDTGICAISDDGREVANAKVMKDAMEIANKVDLPVFCHCEDENLKNGGHMSEGNRAKELGIKGISSDMEDVMVARNIILASYKKIKTHICHISTSTSIDLVEFGKKNNPNLTCEVAPHHFTLTDYDIKEANGNFKMAPPLRNKEDRERVLEALKNDLIDCIATDHAPHTSEEKSCEFDKCQNGIVGLETLVPLTITELVNKGVLTKKQFVEKTSLNPAKVINIDKGHLSVNGVADITIINPVEKHKIDVNKFLSKGKNSPFHNREVMGKVKYTIVNGKVVYSDF
ncbi:MAG: dihydroorotase [Lachnospirales bacterium]